VPQLFRAWPEESTTVRPGVRLGVDVGSARIGIASCDPEGVLASPLATIRRGRDDRAEISRLAVSRQAMEIVVGFPVGLSGKAGVAAEHARAYATDLARAVAPVPVRLVDERFTTVLAHAALAAQGHDARQRRAVVDKAAAATLLQDALDAERRTGEPPGVLVGSPAGAGER
jgi:putative Holliday junction resolvase